MQDDVPGVSAHERASAVQQEAGCKRAGAQITRGALPFISLSPQAMASEYTSMLLQMPDCSLPQSPDAAMAEHLSHAGRFLASPPQYEAVSLCTGHIFQ